MDEIREKIAKGQRLELAEGLSLYEEDLLSVGTLAEEITDQRVGRKVYYSINRHIHYTNVCRFRCGFCGFSRGATEDGAYTMSVSEVATLAAKAQRDGATEIHIVGGVNEELEFDYYLSMLKAIRGACPALHIKAFTAVEIVDLAAKAGQSIEQTLEQLMAVGLDSLPGGGAEIFSDAYFEKACPQKPKPTEWLQVHRTAHRLGLMTNATMLFGYIESREDRIQHLLQLRALQDESLAAGQGRFQCFVPLPYIKNPKSEIRNSKQMQMTEIQNEKTEEARPGHSGTTEIDVVDELKTVAISRLLLDNIDHIKSFWPMLGVQVAQIALCFGADDLDGTVQEYRIVAKEANAHDAGEQRVEPVNEYLSVKQIRRMIEETDREAVQRDGFYKILSTKS